MKWMRERDLLIAQTMAFVQSVTGKKPDADQFVVKSAAFVSVEATQSVDASKAVPPITSMPDIVAILAEPIATAVEPRKLARFAPVESKVDVQSEIRARVANFRAHQERFNREREAYCSATMAKVHAALREDTGLPRQGK